MSHLDPILAVMVGTQNKIVSIEAFRSLRTAGRSTATLARETNPVRRTLSPRSVEHRERMLRFLREEAIARREKATQPESGETQGRLLL